MLETHPQFVLFLFFWGFGFGCGILIGITNLIYTITDKKKLILIIFDIVSCLVSSIIYIIIINHFNWGEHRLYLLFSFVLGIFVERKSIGKLFANLYNKLYNFIVQKLNIASKTKFGTMIRR